MLLYPAGNGALTKKDFLPLWSSWSKKIQNVSLTIFEQYLSVKELRDEKISPNNNT